MVGDKGKIDMYDIILRDCHLPGYTGEVDVAIVQGKIASIATKNKARATTELSCQGLLVTPPFVEPHIHLDSVLTAGEPRFNQSGTLFEGIQIWAERKQSLHKKDVRRRALEALKFMASQGILYVRTHVDVTETKLIALDALLELREEVRDWVTLQIVTFPQDGIFGQPANERLLIEALRRGADVIGGIPHYELTREDGVRSLDRIFSLAARHHCLIDIHCDEIDDEQSRFLEVVAANAIRHGNGERVTASHTTAFACYNDAYSYKLMGFLRRAGINFVANPQINITLQGRMDTYPKRRGMTRVKELWQNGLNVSLGQDCIFDPWYVLGTGNMLSVAHMGIHVAQMIGMQEIEASFAMITQNGARTLQIPDYGIKVGNPANIVVLNAPNIFHALRFQVSARYVIAHGKWIAETKPVETMMNAEGLDMHHKVGHKKKS